MIFNFLTFCSSTTSFALSPTEILPEWWDFVTLHRSASPQTLMLAAQKHPHVPMKWVAEQVAGHQKAVDKLPSWAAVPEICWPGGVALEQCSSEVTARYKASLVQGQYLADLTGGLGVDTAFMAERFEQVWHIERQPDLSAIAAYNFGRLHLPQIQCHCADGLDFLDQCPTTFDWLYLDPARRDQQARRLADLTQYSPNLITALPLLRAKTRHLLVKLSPMLDIQALVRLFPDMTQLYVVAARGECKELLLRFDPDPAPFQIVCVHLHARTDILAFRPDDEQQATVAYQAPGLFLYEPNAALLKGGAFHIPAQQYNLAKLHPNSHLYTSDAWVQHFPGRSFRVDACYPAQQKYLHQHLPQARAHITTRNFPLSPDELRKKFKLADGGDIYLFATTLPDGQKALIQCRKTED